MTTTPKMMKGTNEPNGGSGSSSTSQYPSIGSPHSSQGTSGVPRSQCTQVTIISPVAAPTTSQLDRPQRGQAPRELKSW